MSLLATLFSQPPEFKVLGTKKHSGFTKPKVKPTEVCPFPARSKEAGEWNIEQTYKLLKRARKKMNIYEIMAELNTHYTSQLHRLNELIYDGRITRSQPKTNKQIPVQYWIE